MKSVQILIDTIDKVKTFVNVVSKFHCDFDIISGRYVIDAKSQLGIFSLDISRPLQLDIHVTDDVEAAEIMKAIDPYIAN